MSHHQTTNSRPTLELWTNAIAEERREVCLAQIEIALCHGNREEAEAALARAFRTIKPDTITVNSPVSEILPPKLAGAVEHMRIMTVGELSNCTREYLLTGPNIGEKAIAVIRAEMEKVGFSLKESLPQAPPAWAMRLMAQRAG